MLCQLQSAKCTPFQQRGESAIGKISDHEYKTGHRDATWPEDAQRETDRSGCARIDGVSHAQTAEPIVNFHG